MNVQLNIRHETLCQAPRSKSLYLLEMENSRLRLLVDEWKRANSIPQEAFDWERSRANWQRDIPQHSEFISALPKEIDRDFLRILVADSEISVMEKFLAVMIWGYGDLGYGSYRVNKMFSSDGVEEKISQVFEFCQAGQPLAAYDYLAKNRVTQLGPAFGTKLISFFTPREIVAPIYDSFIWKWMDHYGKDVFENSSSSSEVWSLKTYTKYLDWMQSNALTLGCFGDDLELVIFRDALNQFSSNSSWTGQ
jgi:hypothetical protein